MTIALIFGFTEKYLGFLQGLRSSLARRVKIEFLQSKFLNFEVFNTNFNLFIIQMINALNILRERINFLEKSLFY